MRNSILAFAAAAITVTGTVAAPATAHASPVNATEFDASVEHDDLDLTTQRGIARLDERVRTQIRRACSNGGRDSASIRLERECRASASAAAEAPVRFAIAEANARAERIRFANQTAPSSPTASNADARTPGKLGA